VDPSLTCHVSLEFVCVTCPIGHWNVTRVTLTPPTCQFLIRVFLVNVVGEVTETPRVRDFETLEDLGCIMVERPNESKARATW
jgi:hypothetical protein